MEDQPRFNQELPPVPPSHELITEENRPEQDTQLKPEQELAVRGAVNAVEHDPQAALEHSLASGERNEAVEGERELRVERQKLGSASQSQDVRTTQNAVPIAKIIASAPERQPGLAPLQQQSFSTHPQPPKTPAIAEDTYQKPSIYRQAIIGGFISAVLLLILLAVFLLFTT